MRKLFGELLVDQKVITQDDLLDALMEQIQRAPSAAEVVFKNKYVDSPDMLKALKYQAINGGGFLESLQDLGLVDDETVSQIKQECLQGRPPLGQVLISLGKIDFNSLVHALDNFVFETSVEESEEESKVNPPEQGSSVDELRPTAAKIERALLNQFLGSFGKGLFDSLNTYLSDPANETNRDRAMENLREATNGARFIRADLTRAFTERLSKVVGTDAAFDGEVKDTLLKAVELMQKLRDKLREERSEAAFWLECGADFRAVYEALDAHEKPQMLAAS